MAEVSVEGVVSRLHGRGTGFSVKEEWVTKDGPMSRYWAVFPVEAQSLAEGDRVTVTGSLRTKLSEPNQEGRVFVDHTISDAVVSRGAGEAFDAMFAESREALEQVAPAEDPWPVVAPYTDGTPF